MRIALSILVLLSCQSGSSDDLVEAENTYSSHPKISQAVGFSVSEYENYKTLEIREPFKGASKGLTLILLDRGKTPPPNPKNLPVVQIPVKRLVCTSTSHLPFLDMLNVADRLVGFPSLKWVSSPKIRAKAARGEIVDLGVDSNINTELLLDLAPELVMVYAIAGEQSNYHTLQSVGIPAIPIAEYLEETPLGRAEWIKFIALFFQREQQADSIFSAIERNYLDIREKVANQTLYPKVLSGANYKDTWYVPGGHSWMAKFFKDAGGDYLWKDNTETGSIPLSFESVYEKAAEADYWIGVTGFEGLEQLEENDPRYMNFLAFQKKKVYNNNARLNDEGGNDYFETGVARPDLVLNDLVKILHPQLLPAHSLYFHQQLE